MGLTRIPQKTGSAVLRFFAYFGQVVGLIGELAVTLFTCRPRVRLAGRQIVDIGFGSQLVVVVTGAFTGAVFAAQVYFKFSELGLGTATGPVVSLAMCRELGPVLAGIMVSGRVGAAMAAEIGTMKVTEQIDALRSMGISPVDYLVMPRVIGMFVSMPLLVAESVGFGILAGYVMVVHIFGVPAVWFEHQVVSNTTLPDIAIGMIKGFVFGGLIVLISCREGLYANRGAVGVGKATTAAVVISSLAILVSNLFLSFLLNHFFPLGSSGFDS